MDKPFQEVDAISEAGETFSVADAREIIACVNRVGDAPMADREGQSLDLAQALNRLASLYVADDYQRSPLSASDLRDRLKKISHLSQKLVKELGADENGVAHELGPGVLWKSARIRQEPSGEQAVREAALGVIKIGRFAEFAANLHELGAPPLRGRPPEKAISNLVRGLADVFEGEWISTAGRSSSRIDEQPGRFPTFVRLVFDRLVPNQFTPNGIDSLIRRHLRP
ncbi:MAG: hypothetical protein VX512_12450 [Pseudomonadota bacterium]|nr:hypothetical protein [Pseudomonadota bacterium]